MLHLALVAAHAPPPPVPPLLVEAESTCQDLLIGAYNDGSAPITVQAYAGDVRVVRPFVLPPGEQEPINVTAHGGLRVTVQADGRDLRTFTWAMPDNCPAAAVPGPEQQARDQFANAALLMYVIGFVLTVAAVFVLLYAKFRNGVVVWAVRARAKVPSPGLTQTQPMAPVPVVRKPSPVPRAGGARHLSADQPGLGKELTRYAVGRVRRSTGGS